MKLKVGDTVMVYKDPITRQTPEGKAMILAIQRYDAGIGWTCLVKFEEDGYEVYRRI